LFLLLLFVVFISVKPLEIWRLHRRRC